MINIGAKKHPPFIVERLLWKSVGIDMAEGSTYTTE
jgi:hypothetical protein